MSGSQEERSAPDDALMARYTQGDMDAFGELYARYERPLFGFCLRYLGDPDAAADAFQEVFKRVVHAREAYEPRGRFRSWIFTIARRICTDSVRQARSGAPLEVAAAAWPEAIALQPRFENRVAHADEVRRLLAPLPDEQREALLLSKYEGLSYAEIAEITGSSEAAVKQKVYRAIQTVRALLERQ
ncbi:MAG: sigma-70 family RNA polymerase sigma factor [Gemmatimonadetes bacterium]|nr:sigma-70 family RNA polymerase sigma factor [Gemmatimonadota bacterium]